MLEGSCQVHIYLADVLSGEPVFRWGPSSYERLLQFTSAALGIAALAYGTVGLRSVWLLSVPCIRSFWRFQGLLLVWTVVWHALVGMPVSVEYVRRPAFELWPISKLPGLPTRMLVDPDWPDGRPSVCGDVDDIKRRWAASLRPETGGIVEWTVQTALLHRVFKRVMTCEQTVALFWVWGAVLLVFRTYCIYTAGFFQKVLLHGGDGVTMIGHISDLDKPFHQTRSSRELIRMQIEGAFAQMDLDGDGKLSLEEFEHFLEDTSTLYRGIVAEPKPRQWRNRSVPRLGMP